MTRAYGLLVFMGNRLGAVTVAVMIALTLLALLILSRPGGYACVRGGHGAMCGGQVVP